MDPEHGSIAGRAFFSRAEKNQKAQRRGEKPGGEAAFLRAAAIRTGAAS